MSPVTYQRNTTPDPGPTDSQRLEGRFARRLDELRRRLANSDPVTIAGNCEALYTPGNTHNPRDERLQLAYWSKPVTIACSEWVAFPEGGDQPLPAFDQALLLYYLTTADGLPLAGEWIAFSELPDGRFYNQAFQGYTGAELGAPSRMTSWPSSGRRRPWAGSASRSVMRLSPFGRCRACPCWPYYWQGDEEFPSTCQVLFDAVASHYLPTDAYAILGSALTRKLIKARS